MPSTYTTSLRIEKQATGENTNTWGDKANVAFGDLMEQAVAGVAAVTHDDSANYSLTAINGASDEARCSVLEIGGALTADRNVVCPTAVKNYIVSNETTGGFDIVIKTTGGTGITIPNGKKRVVYCDGTNVVDSITDLPAATTIGETAIVTADSSTTLTNKTIDADNNTVSNLAHGAEVDNPTSGVHGVTGSVVGTTDSQTLTNKTLTTPIIATISNTGALTLPTSTDTLVGRDTTDTLTNKTLTTPVISTISNTGTVTLPTATTTLVGRDTTDTLTNKTLTAPVISTISNTGTLTLPTSTDTLVGRDTTDTLTNKTLTAPDLTSPTVDADIIHAGDTDNKITFGTDTQTFQTGGTSRIDLSDSGFRIGTGVRVTTILDEDAMGTDSATALATQQSIKAYVDAAVAAASSYSPQTAKTATSGTTSDYTGLASGINRITITLNQISLNATDDLIIQLSTSASFVTTGYTSRTGDSGTTNTATTGMALTAGLEAANTVSAVLTMARITGTNTWLLGGNYNRAAGEPAQVSARIALAGALDGVRLTSEAASTFDATGTGQWSIGIE